MTEPITDGGTSAAAPVHRAGFACLVGRPNVGKSTLINALVGSKVAIISDRPQTTRHTIRGIVHRPDAQLVVVDTPGLHRPRTILGERLNDLVRATWSDVDVVALCVPADAAIGPGDRFIARELQQIRKKPIIGIVTKTDLVQKEQLAVQLIAMNELLDFADIVPVSANTGAQVDTVADVIIARLPESPPLYPAGELTDEPEQALVAELIREAALADVHSELPHSVAVVVEEMGIRPDNPNLLDIHANIYVERTSQKPIIVGASGKRIKQIGIIARRQIERLLGHRVNLQLHVKVAKDWQRDPRQLRKLGF